jgi:hypothetical protein
VVDTQGLQKLEQDMERFHDRVQKSGLYLSDYRQASMFMRLVTRIPLSNVDFTTKAVVHALTSFSPKSRYTVGLESKAIRLMQNLLPPRFSDWAIKLFA